MNAPRLTSETERPETVELTGHWEDEVPPHPRHTVEPRRRKCGRRRPKPAGLRGFVVCPHWLDEHGLCPECDR